jgi:hypothetical protein
MRKRTNRTISKIICLSLLAGVVLYACQTDVNEIETSEANHFNITDAKSWYEAVARLVVQNTISVRSASGSEEVITLNPLLNWNIAEMSNNVEWEVVELPWEYEEVKEIFALYEVWQHALANNFVPKNVSKLVVMQNRKTRKTYGFKMKIAPTLDYLLRYGGSLHTNKYLDRDSDLSGVVAFYTLDGVFINGWRYQNGEIVVELIGRSEASIEDVSAPTTRNNLAPEWGRPQSGDAVVVNGTASSNNSHTLLDFNGVDILWGRAALMGNGMANFGASTGTDGGGNNAGNGSSKADKILDVEEKDKKTVEEMLEKILENCLGQALFDRLVNSGRKFNINFTSHRGSDYDRMTFTVNLGVTSEYTFFHELVHAYQALKYPYMLDSKNVPTPQSQMWHTHLMNIEIEAHRIQYYYLINQPGGLSAEMRKKYEEDPMYRSIARLEQNTDRYGNITSAGDFLFDMRDFVVPAFARAPEHKDYPAFNPLWANNVMFASLHELMADAKSCLDKK